MPWFSAALLAVLLAAIVPAWLNPTPARSGITDPLIDVGSSPPIVVDPGQATVPVKFDVVCVLPNIDQACDLLGTLRYRVEGGSWTSIEKPLTARSVTFQLPVPPEDGQYVDYVLELFDAETDMRLTSYPATSTPLRYYAVPTTEIELQPRAFGSGVPPASSVSFSWGPGPGQMGLMAGNESSTIGPQAFDVDGQGNLYVLDQINDRVQVFTSAGVLMKTIAMPLGPLGDIELVDDGTFYVLDTVPYGPGSHPAVHHVTPGASITGPPAQVATAKTPESEPVLIRVDNGVPYVYGTPSDSWLPVTDVAAPSAAFPEPPEEARMMGMPSDYGEVLRVVHDLRRIDLSTRFAPTTGVSLPSVELSLAGVDGKYVGELALVEPDADGGYWIVARTWQEEPTPADHHEVIHITKSGQVDRHFAVDNSEHADAGALSQFVMGPEGDLYQMWTDAVGMQIRRYDLAV